VRPAFTQSGFSLALLSPALDSGLGLAESGRLAARAGMAGSSALVCYMVAAGFFYADLVWVCTLLVGGLA